MMNDLSVKILGEDEKVAIVGGYGVVFGGRDLEGDTFTKETELWLDLVPAKPIMYEHTFSPIKDAIGRSVKERMDDFGVYLEAALDKQQSYIEEVLRLVKEGKLGWSSGSVGHLVDRLRGMIKRWPIVEYSLTLTPAEPRTLGVEQVKSFYNTAGIDLPGAFVKVGDLDGGEVENSNEEVLQWKRTLKYIPLRNSKPLSKESSTSGKLLRKPQPKKLKS